MVVYCKNYSTLLLAIIILHLIYKLSFVIGIMDRKNTVDIVWYNMRFQASTVGLGMYPLWVRGGYCSKKMQAPTILVFNVSCCFNNNKKWFSYAFSCSLWYTKVYTCVSTDLDYERSHQIQSKGTHSGKESNASSSWQVPRTPYQKTTLDRKGPEHTQLLHRERNSRSQSCSNSWKPVIPISSFYRKGNKNAEIFFFRLSKISLKTRIQIIQC